MGITLLFRTKKIFLSAISISTILMSLSGKPGYGMEERIPFTLDNKWRSTTIDAVINMPLREHNRLFNSQYTVAYNPTSSQVAMIDSKADLSSFSMVQRGTLEDSLYPGQRNPAHGEHVIGTILQVSPTTTLVPYSDISTVDKVRACLEHAALDPQIDIINLSFGLTRDQNKNLADFNKDMTDFISAIETVLKAGKIVVKTMGNTQESFTQDENNELIKIYTDLANKCANDPNIKSRLILVGNSSYQNGGTEELHSSSSRSTLGVNDYIVTAPGTDITVFVKHLNCYDTRTGTSMAAPIVSGVIAQLLYEFSKAFDQVGITDKTDMRKIVAESVLRSTRKTNLYTGTELQGFGRGVINYGNAKDSITKYIRLYYQKSKG